MKKRIKQFAFVSALAALSVSGVQAAQYDFTEDFAGGVSGWDRYDPLNQITIPISTESGALKLQFSTQSIPIPEVALIRATSVASSGNFAGDYYLGGITSVSVRVTAVNEAPNGMRLVLKHTDSTRKWWITLSGAEAESAMDYQVPIGVDKGWATAGGDSQEQFLSDLSSIEYLAVEITRGSMTAQAYLIDDVGLQGVPPYRAVSGLVSYDGDAAGDIFVLGGSDRDSWTGEDSDQADSEGAYALTLASRSAKYVKAFLDANNNGVRDLFEPTGELGGAIPDASGDVSGADFTIADNVASSGIPWWWLNQYFGLSPADVGGGSGDIGLEDTDGDGANNYEEYRALTIPTDAESVFEAEMIPDGEGGVVLVWPSASTRNYRVWRADSLTDDFSPIASDIGGTPPFNTYADDTTDGGGPYFYKVQVQ